MPTKIEWADETWNPVTGCTAISPACDHCYARRMAKRLAGRCGYPEAPHEFAVTFHPERLADLSKWKEPRRVFVVSMGDLFHDKIEWLWFEHILAAMVDAPRHTYLMLTKRAVAAQTLLSDWLAFHKMTWLPSNWWLGVTVEDQKRARTRMPFLLNAPVAHRFVSVEPMLGRVQLPDAINGLDWVICGAETGPSKRPMQDEWALDLRDQCRDAGVPFLFKKDSQGKPTLRGVEYREYPRAA